MTPEPIIGRYLSVTVQGRRQRIYVESAGQGTPVLCLHTAGADTRQWRHILNDADLTADYRFFAFDMPWHGKSLPPEGFQTEDYLLTTEAYIDTVLAVARALGLDRPILAGCSMGGRIALQPRCTPAPLPASSRSRRAISSPPGMTSTGSTAPMRMAARGGRRWCRPTSAPTRRWPSAGTPCGCSCNRGRACSGAICPSTPATTA
jgi:pimeloyl-ACP methyl ester carboxylesterase